MVKRRNEITESGELRKEPIGQRPYEVVVDEGDVGDMSAEALHPEPCADIVSAPRVVQALPPVAL